MIAASMIALAALGPLAPAAADNAVLDTGPTISAALRSEGNGRYDVAIWGTGFPVGLDRNIVVAAYDDSQPNLTKFFNLVSTTTAPVTYCLPDGSCPLFPPGSIMTGLSLFWAEDNGGVEGVHCGDQIRVSAANGAIGVWAQDVHLTVPETGCSGGGGGGTGSGGGSGGGGPLPGAGQPCPCRHPLM